MWLLVFAFLFLGLDFEEIPDLIPAPLNHPYMEAPALKKREKEITHLARKKKLSPRRKYLLARFYIEAGMWEEARALLYEIQDLLPEAKIQLGFVDLWECRLEDAYEAFEKTPCNSFALHGLKQIALCWSLKKPIKAICLYRKLIQCVPKDSDLYTALGILLSQKNRFCEAKEELQWALHLAPTNRDAAMQLAQVYDWDNHWDQAEKIYAQYPEDHDAIFARAKHYRKERDYAKADQFLKNLKPRGEKEWQERFIVANHITPSLHFHSHFTKTKEDDPTLNKPVVHDEYLNATTHLTYPLTPQERIKGEGIYFHQRETNILTPTVNYNAHVAGGKLKSELFFASNWEWDVWARIFQAWGEKDKVLFPFHKTFRFEPGSSLTYTSKEHVALLDGHRESFITKNFTHHISEVLWITKGDGGYEYSPDIYLSPKAALYAESNWYQDNNWQDLEWLRLQCDLFTPYLTSSYKLQRSHFKKLTTDYFSWDRQVVQLLRVTLHKPTITAWEWELLWEHSWQSTHELIMPIGTFLFIAKNQYLIGNLLSAKIAWRYYDNIRLMLSAHYFRNTLPYRDYRLEGSLDWQF
ncbi:MAG TPA: tetratricopeptide repeat protein [Chlamydiales bacterium]|nr:MAG: hypothetical protein A3F67_09390 [Verrucomicrobia bacterium RIFCSPHIGHO2_12_FULL_41_10]HLB52292.1 tetratricopeptide repeat protein [Chlamydiales bacterium]